MSGQLLSRYELHLIQLAGQANNIKVRGTSMRTGTNIDFVKIFDGFQYVNCKWCLPTDVALQVEIVASTVSAVAFLVCIISPTS